MYSCVACGDGYGFERPVGGAGFFKFPASIGAPGRADLLFVGVNPRRSSTNIDLATAAMSSGEAFRVLSTNREPGGGGRAGMRYIRPRGPERSTYRWAPTTRCTWKSSRPCGEEGRTLRSVPP